MAQQAFADRPQLLDGGLGPEIGRGGLELHPHQLPVLEGMAQHQVLDVAVESAAMLLAVEPGPANLGGGQRRQEVGETGGGATSRSAMRTAKGKARPSRCSARAWRYQSGRRGPLR